MQHPTKKNISGFTLIEILVVIGMIGVLASTVVVAINPLHQFRQARNTQRISNVNAILNAVGNRIADTQGVFVGDGSCTAALPSSSTVMSNGSAGFDIRPCLVPIYISEVPMDPSTGVNACTDDACAGDLYNTGYTISVDTVGRVTVCAPESVTDGTESPYCLRR